MTKADELYFTASVYYYIARFPFLSSPEKETAYQRHIACYLKAARSFDPPLEQVRIPYEGKGIIGYLRVPKKKRPPVVIFTGGVDTWKSDFTRIVDVLLAEGLAVFAMDMPGTGESAWLLAPKSDRVYGRVIEYLQTRSDVSGIHIGVLMMSFGGYYAVRLALSESRISASVNVGGPIAMSFTKRHVKKVPDVMIATIAHTARQTYPIKPDRMQQLAASLTLGREGFLVNPKYRIPLLSINGDADPLVPIDDVYVISKKVIKQKE